MLENLTVVDVLLNDGSSAKMEVRQIGEQQVASGMFTFSKVNKIINSVLSDITEALKYNNPDKVTIKLGFELCLETGELTALLVKGEGKGNIEIQLEWIKPIN